MGQATRVLLVLTVAGAVVGSAGYVIAMATLCLDCGSEPMDYVALGMILAGFGVFAIGALVLLAIGGDALVRAIHRRATRRDADDSDRTAKGPPPASRS